LITIANLTKGEAATYTVQ